MREYKDVKYPRPLKPLPMHLVVIKEDWCWAWIGGLHRDGYGPHKEFYERKYGPVPAGLQLDHVVCNKRNCVNPDHVEPVTCKVNIWRSLERRGKPQPW